MNTDTGVKNRYLYIMRIFGVMLLLTCVCTIALLIRYNAGDKTEVLKIEDPEYIKTWEVIDRDGNSLSVDAPYRDKCFETEDFTISGRVLIRTGISIFRVVRSRTFICLCPLVRMTPVRK